MKFSEKLIKLRKERSLSQEELGYELNVTRQTVSKWELGQTTPDLDKLLELSKLFNISVDELINDNDSVSEKKGSIVMEEKNNNNNVKTIVIALIIIAIIIGAVVLIVNFSEQKSKEKREEKNREDAAKIINSQQELMKDALERQQELKDRYENLTSENVDSSSLLEDAKEKEQELLDKYNKQKESLLQNQ